MSLKLAKMHHIDAEEPDPFDELRMARRYQGGAVEIFERGIHHDVKHVDVSSMFPNIMICFNLSPETVRLVKKKPYTGQYIITPTYIEVPDAKLNMQLGVEISEEDSISRRVLIDLYARRDAVKSAMSEEERVRGVGPNMSISLGLKVIMNAMYGYNGMEWARYGSYLVAIVCTAMSRFIILKAKGWLEAHGCTPVEMDTDGIYVKGEFDVEELNAYIQHLLDGFEHAYRLTLDSEEYEGMIAVRMKNYILRYHGENIFKGSGFHGSKVPDICEDTVDRIATALFMEMDPLETWLGCEDMLLGADVNKFEMTARPSKPANEYAEGNMYRKLMEKLPNFDWGGEIRYVKERDGYTPIGTKPDEEMDIDYNYYHGKMIDSLERLEIPALETRFGRKKARKCSGCGKRLNSRVRFLDSDKCWECHEDDT